MSATETIVFFAGLTVILGFPVGFLLAGSQWFWLFLYAWTAAAYLRLQKTMCSRCMNFACPLNSVPAETRRLFFQRNPVVAEAWQKPPSAGT